MRWWLQLGAARRSLPWLERWRNCKFNHHALHFNHAAKCFCWVIFWHRIACRLVQHRPEKAFLKERDDLADTVLHSYMRNTSDVLRMIEVRQGKHSCSMAFERSVSCQGMVGNQPRGRASNVWSVVENSGCPRCEACHSGVTWAQRPRTASSPCPGPSMTRRLPSQDRSPPSTLRVYHTTAWVARAKDSPKKHQNLKLGRHGATLATMFLFLPHDCKLWCHQGRLGCNIEQASAMPDEFWMLGVPYTET